MFSTGQLVFAACFVVAFIAVMIYVYRQDLALHKKYYKGSYRILIAFLLFIAALFVVKFLTKDNA